MQAWLDRLRQGTDLTAVAMPLASGPGAYLRLSLVQGELHVVERGRFTTWAAAPFPTTRPVVLALYGKGVVHRRIAGGGRDDDKAFSTAFPATGEHALMATVVRSGEAVFLDAARAAQVDSLITAAHDAGHHVVDVVLGPSVIALLHPAVGAPPEMRTPAASFLFAGQDLTSVSPSTDMEGTFEVGGERFDAPALHAFAAAYTFVSGGHGTAGRTPVTLEAGRREERDRKRFRSVLRAALVAAIALLAGLAMVRRSTDRRYEAGVQAQLDDQGRSERLTQLMAAIEEKEAVIRNAGLERSLHAAYKADRIASVVPAGVMLDRLAVDVSRSNARGPMVLGTGRDTILVQGHLTDPVLLNTFITGLEEQEAFQGARLRSVLPTGRDGAAKFEIILRTR